MSIDEDIVYAVRGERQLRLDLRVHADTYGTNPNLICIGGGSAGGHLAALIGTTASKGLVQGADDPAHVARDGPL